VVIPNHLNRGFTFQNYNKIKLKTITDIQNKLSEITLKMFKTFSVAIISATAMAAQEFTYRYQGKNYFSWSARHKWERMYDELADDLEGLEDYHYDSMPELFLQKSNKTTCNPNDELPA